jgi:hypothetical protein
MKYRYRKDVSSCRFILILFTLLVLRQKQAKYTIYFIWIGFSNKKGKVLKEDK